MCGGANVSNRRLLPKSPNHGDIAVWDSAQNKWVSQPNVPESAESGQLLFANDGAMGATDNLVFDNSAVKSLVVNNTIRIGKIAPANYVNVTPGFAIYSQGLNNSENFLSVFHSAQNSTLGVCFRYLNQRGIDPLNPQQILAGDRGFVEQVSPFGTGPNFTASYSVRELIYLTNATTGNSPDVCHSIRCSPWINAAMMNVYPTGVMIGTLGTLSHLTTPDARFTVRSMGTGLSFIAKFQNSTGISDSLTIRDNGQISFSNNLVWENTTGRLYVGYPSANASFLGNSGAIHTFETPSTPVAHIISHANVRPANFSGRRYNGTLAAPQASLANDQLAVFTGQGHNGTGFSVAGQIMFVAAENYSLTNSGGHMDFYTTLTGTNTNTWNMRLSALGNFYVGAPNNNSNANTRFGVYGRGTGNTSFAAQFHNSSGNSNTLIVRDDIAVGIGTNVINAFLQLAGGVSSKASLNIAAGIAPTSPISGDIWFDGSIFNFRIGAATNELPLINVGMLDFGSNYELRWSNTANDKSAIKDLGLKRLAPGLLEVTNGFTGCGALKACYLITGDLSSGALITAKSLRVGSSDVVSDGSLSGLGITTQIAIEHDGIVYYVPVSTAKFS